MEKRFTILPVMMVIVVALLAAIAIASGRSNDTGLVGDRNYPFHICTFNDYCEGPNCSRDPSSFIVYLQHANGQPLLEMERVNPLASMAQTTDGIQFSTIGGEIAGTLNIYSDRQLEFIGTSGETDDPVEHFGSGKCERLKTP